MSARARGRAVALIVAALALPGCAEVESKTAESYEPAKLEAVPGSEDLKRVTFTAEGAPRATRSSTRARRSGPTCAGRSRSSASTRVACS